MKDLFPGHFKESEKNLKQVWDSCIFVFDANILLNFYRYSDSARREFLQLLQKIQERVWLPHRAAEEYLNNRLSVIDQQERSYDETAKAINSLRSDLDNARQHPFVSQQTMNQVNKVFDLLCNELSENKGIHTKRISNDEIKESISSIFENNVGQPYSREDLENLIVDGEERYKQKIPPGFKDGIKSGDSDVFTEKCRKYGDLIVWNQVIDKSIEAKKGIVLVTDDKKEDWWEKFKGKTIGPRPELVKEFKDRAENTFHMYQADRFLELARENLNEQVSDEIVEEIREVRRRDKIAYKKMKEMEFIKRRKLKVHHLMDELEQVRHQMMSYEKEMSMLQEKRHMLENERNSLREHRNHMLHDGDREVDIDRLMQHYESVSEDYAQIKQHLDHSKSKYNEMSRHMMSLEQELAHSMKVIEQENAADS
ncbi:PIN-like domain-containing protein [Halomonas citrativorans]|uniref:PIN-like domain-containing protein n=4 Tax=Halomonadaceae TaxID=28256 RepID=UPI001868E895|nr:PIN-like domain-containing protein [Halomonas citrativorans]